MTEAKRAVEEGRFTGWHMLAVMVGFFGVVIAVNLFMATLASRSWTGLVVKNTYVASQQHNKILDSARKQHEAGWHSQIRFEDRRLAVIFRDREGRSVEVDNPSVFIGRPAYEQDDRRLQLHPVSRGIYETDAELGRGEWLLRVEANVHGQPYRRDARIFVADNGRGKVQ